MAIENGDQPLSADLKRFRKEYVQPVQLRCDSHESYFKVDLCLRLFMDSLSGAFIIHSHV